MPLRIDASEARDFLRARGHDASDLEPLSGGEWSTAFAFRTGDREYVVRFHERRDDLEKDRYAQRWVSGRLRTPRIVEIGDLAGGAYGISERVRGPAIDTLDEAGMRRALPSLLAAMDAMREADLAGTRGYWGWHGDGNAEAPSWRDTLLGRLPGRDVMGEWRAAVVASPLGITAFDAAVAGIHELLPFCPEERALVHEDLLNYNVLVDDRGVVLLDWGASWYGDFVYDVALLTFWWPRYERWPRIAIREEVERHWREIGLRVPSFAERLRCCQLHIGIEHMPYQAARGRLDDARWTASHTLELLDAPL
ncbi:MAG TPA: aminoglycoside phosphotransferase family protein [Candidatus Limnocylindria bacterium]|nr:aminoglycoside phosphotransferase family protein [Candidatus Limnocylindria bacterium]